MNLSARQFHDPGLLALVQRELDASSLPADRLIIEITEGVALMEVSDTMKMIEQLTKLGIGVALDDFGTGFSSLSYLALLNPMIIKIDQTFVRPTFESIHSDRLLETIVSLGHNLGMTMLAEGIETEGQLESLRVLALLAGSGVFLLAGRALRRGGGDGGNLVLDQVAHRRIPAVLRGGYYDVLLVVAPRYDRGGA